MHKVRQLIVPLIAILSLLFAACGSTSSVSGGTKPQEVSMYGSYYINNNYKLDAVIYGGLSDASPDVGGGLTLKYYF